MNSMQQRYSELVDVRLGNIRISGANPKNVTPESVETMAQSIEAMGVCSPLIIWPSGNGYILLDGHCRLAGIQRLYPDTWENIELPCVVCNAATWEEACACIVQYVSMYNKPIVPKVKHLIASNIICPTPLIKVNTPKVVVPVAAVPAAVTTQNTKAIEPTHAVVPEVVSTEETTKEADTPVEKVTTEKMFSGIIIKLRVPNKALLADVISVLSPLEKRGLTVDSYFEADEQTADGE